MNLQAERTLLVDMRAVGVLVLVLVMVMNALGDWRAGDGCADEGRASNGYALNQSVAGRRPADRCTVGRSVTD